MSSNEPADPRLRSFDTGLRKHAYGDINSVVLGLELGTFYVDFSRLPTSVTTGDRIVIHINPQYILIGDVFSATSSRLPANHCSVPMRKIDPCTTAYLVVLIRCWMYTRDNNSFPFFGMLFHPSSASLDRYGFSRWIVLGIGRHDINFDFSTRDTIEEVSKRLIHVDAMDGGGSIWDCMKPPSLSYLNELTSRSCDIFVLILIKPVGQEHSYVVTQSNFKHIYWSITQQLAHHTINGCNMQPGDILGTRTIISGPV